jgi:hypothetical protein
MDACRMAIVACLPIRASAWPNPMVVVVFPSPNGVGVMAVTTTYRAWGRPASAAVASRLILATWEP